MRFLIALCDFNMFVVCLQLLAIFTHSALSADTYASRDVTRRAPVYKETLKEHLQHLKEGRPNCQGNRFIQEELLIRHHLTNRDVTCNDGSAAGWENKSAFPASQNLLTVWTQLRYMNIYLFLQILSSMRSVQFQMVDIFARYVRNLKLRRSCTFWKLDWNILKVVGSATTTTRAGTVKSHWWVHWNGGGHGKVSTATILHVYTWLYLLHCDWSEALLHPVIAHCVSSAFVAQKMRATRRSGVVRLSAEMAAARMNEAVGFKLLHAPLSITQESAWLAFSRFDVSFER